MPVDTYLIDGQVRNWQGKLIDARAPNELPTECPGVVKSPCFTLKPVCQTTSCASGLHAVGPREQKAVYVRVAKKSDWEHCRNPRKRCADGSPNPFAEAPERRHPVYAKETVILVEYWYFYPFNDWVAPVVAGELHETHAGDWESVTVGLAKHRPLWVAYSAHCAGTFADWPDVPTADPKQLRPAVAVAAGSQANYRLANGDRVPNFAECSGIAKDRLTLISYAANIRDRTGNKTRWDPNPSNLILVDAQRPPMNFPGLWSTRTRLSLENLRKSHTLKDDPSGPLTPSLQAVWQSPMRSIFGGGPWERAD
jgi:hypothetical protein